MPWINPSSKSGNNLKYNLVWITRTVGSDKMINKALVAVVWFAHTISKVVGCIGIIAKDAEIFDSSFLVWIRPHGLHNLELLLTTSTIYAFLFCEWKSLLYFAVFDYKLNTRKSLEIFDKQRKRVIF